MYLEEQQGLLTTHRAIFLAPYSELHLLNYIYLFMYFEYDCVEMCHCAYVEVRGQLSGVSFLVLLCGSQGSNSGLSSLVVSAFTHGAMLQPLGLIPDR